MSTMFGIPDFPMGDDSLATQVVARQCAHVIIAYPGVRDWLNLYDPLRSRDMHLNRQSFKSLSDHHFLSIAKTLDAIAGKATGRALFTELAAAPNEVLIYPFDFQPSADWRIDPDAKVIAETTPGGVMGAPPSSANKQKAMIDNTLRTFRVGVPLCGENGRGQAICVAAPGGGGRTAIFFEALRADSTQNPDEVLAHELVHAARQMRGLKQTFPMSGGYHNIEEFYANLVQNLYRSECHAGPVWYGGAPIIDPASFLDSPISPPPRMVIAMLRSQQPAFFAALARVASVFNPIREVDAESKAYVAGIERA